MQERINKMLELTKETFEDEVLQAEGLVFVDYYGDSCAPCEALRPRIEELAAEFAGSFKFTALNTSKARRLAISQKVLGLPVLAVYKGGEKIRELVGDNATADNLGAMLRELSA
jgi:thioredoxin 1